MKIFSPKITLLFITIFCLNTNLFSQKLHCIYITDYEDSIFGTNNLEAETIMATMLENAAQGLGYEFPKAIYFNHLSFNSVGILKNIKELVTTPEDIIMVFYFGRGVKNAKSKFQSLKLNDTNLPMEVLAGAIELKHYRLAMLMADFLDNKIEKGFGYKGINRETAITQDLNFLQTNQLFKQNKGLYIVSSAQQNMPVNFIIDYLEPKSVFINSLFNAYVTNTNQPNVIGIKDLGIDFWLSEIQIRMNADINLLKNDKKIPQKLVIEHRPLKPNIIVKKHETFDYPLSFLALEKMLNKIIVQPNTKIRNEMLENLTYCVVGNITISKSKNNKIIEMNKILTVDQYFKTLLINDHKLLSIRVLNNESQVDFPFETIRIEEKWN